VKFFERSYTVRRYAPPQEVNGYTTAPTYEEITCLLDVQIESPSKNEYNPDGQRLAKNLTSWGDDRMRSSDAVTQEIGDRLRYEDGFWYECTSCEYLNHTVLHHWHGSWQRVPEGRVNHP
jgi:hypothetical protein